jgi:hypothetical protein
MSDDCHEGITLLGKVFYFEGWMYLLLDLCGRLFIEYRPKVEFLGVSLPDSL